MKASIITKLEILVERYEEVQALLGDPDTMSNQDKYRELTKEYSQLEVIVICFQKYQGAIEDLDAAKMMLEDNDPEMREMAADEIADAKQSVADYSDELQILLLPKDPNDERNCYLEIRAGAGGDEAAIFAGNLFRMYSKFVDTKKWHLEVMNSNSSEQGGYKELIAKIDGEGAYGLMKFESGGHRVQRVPETESQGRIHTSACTVVVMPEIPESEAVSINPADLKVDTFRASGAGGQHVNTTESAVRITHVPTNIVVQCQNDRSQHKNKDQAMKQLKAKLYEHELQLQNAEKQISEDGKSDIGWGSQIRSYVLDDARIKDLRTGVESRNTQAVLDGGLDKFIEASLKSGL